MVCIDSTNEILQGYWKEALSPVFIYFVWKWLSAAERCGPTTSSATFCGQSLRKSLIHREMECRRLKLIKFVTSLLGMNNDVGFVHTSEAFWGKHNLLLGKMASIPLWMEPLKFLEIWPNFLNHLKIWLSSDSTQSTLGLNVLPKDTLACWISQGSNQQPPWWPLLGYSHSSCIWTFLLSKTWSQKFCRVDVETVRGNLHSLWSVQFLVQLHCYSILRHWHIKRN